MGEQILEFCIAFASGGIKPKSVLLGQDDFYTLEKRGVAVAKNKPLKVFQRLKNLYKDQ